MTLNQKKGSKQTDKSEMLTIDYSELTNRRRSTNQAKVVKDPFEDNLLAQTILHNNRGKFRLRNYQDSIMNSFDYKKDNFLNKATRHNTRKVEVSKLRDEMDDIKRGQVKEYENASNTELYSVKKQRTMTPLIDPEPLAITTKNGCGNRNMSSGAEIYVAMVARNLQRNFKGSPAFTNKSNEGGLNLQRRTRQRILMARRPDQGNYDTIDLTYKKPNTIRMDKTTKRNDLRIRRDADQEAFNRLEDADYSSFKP